MKIIGHRTEKEFYRYIGVDKEENADMVRTMHDRFKIEKGKLHEGALKIA